MDTTARMRIGGARSGEHSRPAPRPGSGSGVVTIVVPYAAGGGTDDAVDCNLLAGAVGLPTKKRSYSAQLRTQEPLLLSTGPRFETTLLGRRRSNPVTRRAIPIMCLDDSGTA